MCAPAADVGGLERQIPSHLALDAEGPGGDLRQPASAGRNIHDALSIPE